jgi:hypothetical protein
MCRRFDAVENSDRTAGLTFSAGNDLLVLSVGADTDMSQRHEPGRFPMTLFGPFVSRLSVVAAYVAFAFVGAIVLGVF